MINVYLPKNFEPERQYVVSLVLSIFLGLEIQLIFEERQGYRLTCNDCDRNLTVADTFFPINCTDWLSESSLPKQPLAQWDICDRYLREQVLHRTIPVLYSEGLSSTELYSHSDQKAEIGLDIFGSIFFMLTRYEEVVKTDRDAFDRFPHEASIAFQENFLNRAIVNEYVDILWLCLSRFWPQLQRRTRKFETKLSHDVDIPYEYTFMSMSSLIKRLGRSIYHRKSSRVAVLDVAKWQKARHKVLLDDPFNTFDWLMKLSEDNNIKSAFYFITDHTDRAKDGTYCMTHPFIRSLLRCISDRGHEIGLHPSFNSSMDKHQIKKEFSLLKKNCAQENIFQCQWGGRQHFLRWHNPQTWQAWDYAGLSYDSTLTFAGIVGFRCGTCYEFPVYDLISRQPLSLVERPLIAMECSLLAERYMGLGSDLPRAFDQLSQLKNVCRYFDGYFTLLWHNSNFGSAGVRDLYSQILTA